MFNSAIIIFILTMLTIFGLGRNGLKWPCLKWMNLSLNVIVAADSIDSQLNPLERVSLSFILVVSEASVKLKKKW